MGEGNLFSVGVDNTRLLKNLTELQKVISISVHKLLAVSVYLHPLVKRVRLFNIEFHLNLFHKIFACLNVNRLGLWAPKKKRRRKSYMLI